MAVGIAAGLMLGLILLIVSGRPAGAATLPSPITQTVAPVTTTLSGAAANSSEPLAAVVPTAPNDGVLSPVLSTVSSTTSSVSTDLLNGATGAGQSLGGSNTLLGFVPALIPALPVPSSPAPGLLGGVEGQGLRTTSTQSSRTLSAPTVDVVSGTGSAAFFFGTSTRSALVATPAWPFGPQRLPRLPSLPGVLLAMAATGSGSGAHNGPLDSLPPTILVLALLVAAGMGLEHRRRPKARFDLRFSPPG